MKFINILLDFSLFLLSVFVPKQNNTFLLGAGDGFYFKGNTKYIYLYLLKHRPDLQTCWISSNKELIKELNGKGCPAVNKYSLKGFYKILRSKFLIIEIMPKDIIYAGFMSVGRFHYIQTFHGMPLKKIANDANVDLLGITRVSLLKIKKVDIFFSKIKAWFKRAFLYRNYNLITSSCQECNDIYKKAFVNDCTEILGFARNDIFFDREIIYNDYQSRKEFSGFRKIISYIPTFRDKETSNKPFPDGALHELNEFLKKENILLVVKKHQYDTNLIIDSGFSNIIDVSSEIDDVMELLVMTDILITDYSSVFFDFSLSGRPIIYYCYDIDEYLRNCRKMYADFYSIVPGPFAANFTELLSLLKNIDDWFNNTAYQEKYSHFREKYNFFLDGDSGRRLIEHLIEY